MATPLRVLLIDDHDLVRQGIAGLLETQADLQVVGQGSSAAQADSLVRTVAADCLVVDVSLGDGSGLDVARRARAHYPRLGIVVLTMHQDDDTLLGALDAGASALVHKSRNAEDVIAAVRQSAATPESFSAIGLAEAMRRRAAAPAVRLTPRETDVLTRLADGSSVAEVAAELFMSESTVKSHIGKVYEKLGAKNRASAVMAAIRMGLIQPPS